MTLEEMNELKILLYAKNKKKKRALSHGQSACDEDFYFILCLLYFCFSKKKKNYVAK